jgi:hypothetical protein
MTCEKYETGFPVQDTDPLIGDNSDTLIMQPISTISTLSYNNTIVTSNQPVRFLSVIRKLRGQNSRDETILVPKQIAYRSDNNVTEMLVLWESEWTIPSFSCAKRSFN